jgi:hypothetical protein
MIVEIKMIFIGTTKFLPKNRSELVFFGCVNRKKPVLGGPVRSPQYLGRSWTGCGSQLRVFGAKNRTEPDLKTLFPDMESMGMQKMKIATKKGKNGGWIVMMLGVLFQGPG